MLMQSCKRPSIECFCDLQGDGSETPDSKEEAGPYWSLMFEVSESYMKPVNRESGKFAGGTWDGLVKETIQGALNTKLISGSDEIVSIYHRYDQECLLLSRACSLRVSCGRHTISKALDVAESCLHYSSFEKGPCCYMFLMQSHRIMPW